MRKMTLALSLGAVCVAILSGCKIRNKYKAPSTPYEKVSVALSGVEKSLSNYKSSEKPSSGSKTRTTKRIAASDSSGALAEIASIYSTNDSLGDKIDDLEFNQPPILQFEVIKNIFESAGSSFVFGTKYIETITGEVYLDILTGEIAAGDEYKYNYEFTTGLSIIIDSDDLITADLSFDINLTKGETTLHTSWYLALFLDYEMEKESPTYTLTTYIDNEESDLTYLEYGNTYEYGFIDMRDSRIYELRKFCYEINKRMVKDATHSKFSDYEKESNLRAQITASKWYKNADLRQIKHPNTSKTMRFIEALFDKFAINTTDINADLFVKKEGTKTDFMKNAYKKLETSLKQDIIYSLVTGSDHREIVKNAIHVMNSDVSNRVYDIALNKDTNIKTLFNGEDGNYAIWYFDKNGEALEQAEKLDEINFRLFIPYGLDNENITFDNTLEKTDEHYLDLNASLSEPYKKMGKQNYLQRKSVAYLFINDGLLNAVLTISIGGETKDLVDTYYKGFFPEELEALEFPVYEGENCLFEYNEEQMGLDISNTNSEELDTFIQKVESLEWTKSEQANLIIFTKLTVNNELLRMSIEKNNSAIQKGNLRITYSVEEIEHIDWPKDTIKEASNNIFVLDKPNSKNGYFVFDDEQENTVLLKNFDEQEKQGFFDLLESSGEKAKIQRTNSQTNEINSINVLLSNKIYVFSLKEIGNDISFTYKVDDEKSYSVFDLTIEKEGEVDSINIELNEELNGYFFEGKLDKGVYKVKKVNPLTSEEIYLSIEGYELDCYLGKVEYSNKELTVNEEVDVVFYMEFSQQSNFIRMLENGK